MNHRAKEIKMKDPILTELAQLAKAWGFEYRRRMGYGTSEADTKEMPTC